MATPTIKIDQAGLAPGTAGASRDDLVVGALVTLTDPANPSGTFAWTLAAKPPGSAATLSGAASSTATFTPDVPGTYLIDLVANGSASYTTEVTGAHVPIGNQGGCGVKFRNDLRAPAAGETTQFGPTGWYPALYGAIFATPRVLQVQDGDDITAAVKAAIAQATRSGGWGGRIHLPEGRFEICDTILFPQIAGMSIVGGGVRSTQLVWTGAAGIPMFDFNRCQDCGLSSLYVVVEAGTGSRSSSSRPMRATRPPSTARTTSTASQRCTSASTARRPSSSRGRRRPTTVSRAASSRAAASARSGSIPGATRAGPGAGRSRWTAASSWTTRRPTSTSRAPTARSRSRGYGRSTAPG